MGLFNKTQWERAPRQDLLLERKWTDSKGIASFPGALSLLREKTGSKTPVLAGLAFPLARSLFHPIRLEEATFRKPAPQVTLHAPDLGFLKVHAPATLQAQAPGKFLLSVVPAFFHVPSMPPQGRRWTLACFGIPPRAETAFFPVGLGLDLEIYWLLLGLPLRRAEKVQGPTMPGQVVEVFLDPQDVDWCRGRALDGEGRILANETIQYFVPKRREAFLIEKKVLPSLWGKAESNGEGWFRFPLPKEFKQVGRPGEGRDGFLQVLFQVLEGKGKDSHGLSKRAAAEIPASRPGGLFLLGKVVFHPPCFSIGVRLVDPTGRPVPRARVLLGLSRKNPSGGATLRYDSDQNGNCRFRIYSEEGDYSLDVSKPGYKEVKTDPRPLETTVRVLEMHRLGRIAYQVLLGKEAWKVPVYPKVVLQAYQILPEKECRGSSAVFGPGSSKGTIPKLDPGVYRVEVKLYGGKDSILSLDGIKVEGGKTTKDPRLNKLDLKAYVNQVSLEVIPPEKWRGRVYSPGRHLVREGGNHYRFLLSRPFPSDILLQGPGVKDKVVTLTGPARKVTLEKGLPLRLSLSGRIPKLPPGVGIGAREMPLCPRRCYMGSGFFEGLADHYEDWRSTGGLGEFDENGNCRLLVGGPGRRKIELFLVSRMSGRGPRCLPFDEIFLHVPSGGGSAPMVRMKLDETKLIQGLKKLAEQRKRG